MSSREEILHLMSIYGFTMDTGGLGGFAGLFANGEWEMEGAEPFRGKEHLLAGLDSVILYGDGTPRTKHVTANVELEIDEGAGKAKSQACVTVFQKTDSFPCAVTSVDRVQAPFIH